MTDLSALITQIRELLPKVSEGPWHAGHLCDDDHPCNCRGVVNEGYAGAICTVHVDNGLPVGEGGNDSPPLSEAKANLLWLALLNPVTVTALLDRIEELEQSRDVAQGIHDRLRESSYKVTAEWKARAEAAESRLAKAGAEALEPIIAEIKKLKTNFGMAAYVSGYKDGRNDALSIVEEAAAALKSGGANG